MTKPRRLMMICFVFLSGVAIPVGAQSVTSPQPLLLGASIERELAGAQTHLYQLDAVAGQYWFILVNQKGIDVVVSILGDEKQKLAEIDSPNGSEGNEPLHFIAKTSGSYVLEVRSLEASAPRGRYEIKLVVQHPATEQDRLRVTANKLFGEATTLRNGNNAENMRLAISKYEAALPLYHQLGDRQNEADTLSSLGYLYYNYLGEITKAIEYHESELPLQQLLKNQFGEAIALNNLGHLYSLIGEQEQAVNALLRSSSLLNGLGRKYNAAIVYDLLAKVYLTQGEIASAFASVEKALTFFREVGSKRDIAIATGILASIFSTAGLSEQAIEHYKQALQLCISIKEEHQAAIILNSLATSYSKLERYREALEVATRALASYQKLGLRDLEGNGFITLGIIYTELGELQKGMVHLQQGLVIAQSVGDKSREFSALHWTAINAQRSNDLQKADALFEESLRFIQAASQPDARAATLYLQALVKNKLGRRQEALDLCKESLHLTEALRTRMVGDDQRISYLASVQERYAFYTDLLMQDINGQFSEARSAEALEVNERGQARSLLDLLAEIKTDFTVGVDQELLKQQRLLRSRLNAKANLLERLGGSNKSEDKKQNLLRDIAELNAQSSEIVTKIQLSSPRYTALTQPQPLTIKEIQQQALDNDTLLLEFAIGATHSYLWVVSPQEIKSYQLPSRAEITAAARKVYDQLTQIPVAGAVAKSPADAQALSQMLLGAAAPNLGSKRLLIVAPEILSYIPFAALPEPVSEQNATANRPPTPAPRPPLIVSHEIVNLPSASVLAVLRKEIVNRKAAPKTVAVLADPVFEANDPRVALAKAKGTPPAPNEIAQNVTETSFSRAVRSMNLTDERATLGRLAFSREEAEAIAAFTNPTQGLKALSFDASRATAMSDKLSQYRIVHFATHGLLNSAHPELSGLVFSLLDEKGKSQDGFLRLHEIYNLKLPADLVVLSACQTGLGKEIKGEGLIGLTRGFMYAGAPRVVASLWRVNDYATAELMKRFYKGMLKDNLRPAAALRHAQIEMWKLKRFAAPYYWAAFILQGEWR